MRYFLVLTFILMFTLEGLSQKDLLKVYYLKTNTLFDSKQEIYILNIKGSLKKNIDIAYSKSKRIKTSKFAKSNNALAAINGGFFNMKKGGSVSYLEKNDELISENINNSKTFNGIVLYTKDKKLEINKFLGSNYYKESEEEAFALVSGPLLIKSSVLQNLPDINFTNKRHPRTCLCKTKDAILFVVIDGRTKKAEGMSLIETQKYLEGLGCIDAINLDGGGSSTLWVKGKGIVNYPSGKRERAVANSLLVLSE